MFPSGAGVNDNLINNYFPFPTYHDPFNLIPNRSTFNLSRRFIGIKW